MDYCQIESDEHRMNTSEMYARFVFNTKVQKIGESIDSYVAALVSLSWMCNFDFLRESLIRDRILVGVRDREIQLKLLQGSELSLQQCIRICKEAEGDTRRTKPSHKKIKLHPSSQRTTVTPEHFQSPGGTSESKTRPCSSRVPRKAAKKAALCIAQDLQVEAEDEKMIIAPTDEAHFPDSGLSPPSKTQISCKMEFVEPERSSSKLSACVGSTALHPEGEVKCDEFPNGGSVQQKLVCPFCGRAFMEEERQSLNAHKESCQGSQLPECRSFVSARDGEQHMQLVFPSDAAAGSQMEAMHASQEKGAKSKYQHASKEARLCGTLKRKNVKVTQREPCKATHAGEHDLEVHQDALHKDEARSADMNLCACGKAYLYQRCLQNHRKTCTSGGSRKSGRTKTSLRMAERANHPCCESELHINQTASGHEPAGGSDCKTLLPDATDSTAPDAEETSPSQGPQVNIEKTKTKAPNPAQSLTCFCCGSCGERFPRAEQGAYRKHKFHCQTVTCPVCREIMSSKVLEDHVRKNHSQHGSGRRGDALHSHTPLSQNESKLNSLNAECPEASELEDAVESFTDDFVLAEHEESLYGQLFCSESESSKDDLIWTCSICKQKVFSVREVQMHCTSEHKSEVATDSRFTFHCHCGAEYPWNAYFEHKVDCHKVACSTCSDVMTLDELLDGISVEDDASLKVGYCSMCGESLEQIWDTIRLKLLKAGREKLSKALRDWNGVVDPEKEATSLVCKPCKMKFSHVKYVLFHTWFSKVHKNRCSDTVSKETKSLPLKHADGKDSNNPGMVPAKQEMQLELSSEGGKCEKTLAVEEKLFKCGVCDEEFSDETLYSMHMKYALHSKKKGARILGCTCQICGKHFRTRRVLREHLRSHTNSDEETFKCDVCQKTFQNFVVLSQHVNIHKNENRWKCEYCGRLFQKEAYLKIHRRLHTGEFPYECRVCGKRYHSCSGLHIHMRTHTGERPYTCEVCGKGFTVLCHLKNHKASHSEERPYSCSICGRRFKTDGSMKRHEFLHSGVKDYVCDACGAEFARSSGLHQHVRKHHPSLATT